MYPVLFKIGNMGIYTYGLFVALGLLTAIFVTKKLAVPQGIKAQLVTDIFFVILISAVIGSRLLYVVINWKAFQNNLLDIFTIWNGGLVFFGGFITAVIGACIYAKKQNLEIFKTADLLAPGVALGHSVGRIGCFFAGCCYGKACDLPFAIRFTHPDTLAPHNVYLHPTQLYMMLSNLILFGILFLIYRKRKFNGQVFLIYIMLYSVFRSFIEFFRGDFRGDFIWNFLSMSQGIGALAFVTALCFYIYLLFKHKAVNATG